jgi:hypothetical protein
MLQCLSEGLFPTSDRLRFPCRDACMCSFAFVVPCIWVFVCVCVCVCVCVSVSASERTCKLQHIVRTYLGILKHEKMMMHQGELVALGWQYDFIYSKVNCTVVSSEPLHEEKYREDRWLICAKAGRDRNEQFPPCPPMCICAYVHVRLELRV